MHSTILKCLLDYYYLMEMYSLSITPRPVSNLASATQSPLRCKLGLLDCWLSAARTRRTRASHAGKLHARHGLPWDARIGPEAEPVMTGGDCGSMVNGL